MFNVYSKLWQELLSFFSCSECTILKDRYCRAIRMATALMTELPFLIAQHLHAHSLKLLLPVVQEYYLCHDKLISTNAVAHKVCWSIHFSFLVADRRYKYICSWLGSNYALNMLSYIRYAGSLKTKQSFPEVNGWFQ